MNLLGTMEQRRPARQGSTPGYNNAASTKLCIRPLCAVLWLPQQRERFMSSPCACTYMYVPTRPALGSRACRAIGSWPSLPLVPASNCPPRRLPAISACLALAGLLFPS